jgi:hypothetical protein
MAATGIAANRIGGTTVFWSFGFTTKQGQVRSTLDEDSERAHLIAQSHVLIVDEAGMLNGDVLLAMNDAARLFEWRLGEKGSAGRSNRPFGQRLVVLCGDFAQIPAVVEGSGDRAVEAAHQVWATRLFLEQFDPLLLTEVVRAASNDPDRQRFLDLQNSVRYVDGPAAPEEVRALIREKLIEPTAACEKTEEMVRDSKSALMVSWKHDSCATLRDIAQRTASRGEAMEALSWLFVSRPCMVDAGIEDPERRLRPGFRGRRAYPSEVKQFNGFLKRRDVKTLVPLSLRLRVGDRVMIVKNIDLPNHIYKGAMGTFKEAIYNEHGQVMFLKLALDGRDEPYLLARHCVAFHEAVDSKIYRMIQFPDRWHGAHVA